MFRTSSRNGTARLIWQFSWQKGLRNANLYNDVTYCRSQFAPKFYFKFSPAVPFLARDHPRINKYSVTFSNIGNSEAMSFSYFISYFIIFSHKVFRTSISMLRCTNYLPTRHIIPYACVENLG